jgi:hypothetical protein
MDLAPFQVGTPAVTTDMLVVLGVVGLALVLVVTEALAVDVTAILIMVLLVVLEPWTGIDSSAGWSPRPRPSYPPSACSGCSTSSPGWSPPSSATTRASS